MEYNELYRKYLGGIVVGVRISYTGVGRLEPGHILINSYNDKQRHIHL